MPLILDGTLGVSGVDGSAGTPSLQGTDTNTGVFFPAADVIAFTTNGTEDARFDSAGNFGIGTSSPNTRLDVKSSGIGFEINPNNSGNAVIAAFNRNTINFSTAVLQGDVVRFDTGTLGSNTERMRIDSSGNVGIGTSSPSVKLQLQSGVFHITDGTQTLRQGVTTGFGFVGMQSNHALVLFTNDAERMRITSGGDLCIASTSSTNASKLTVIGKMTSFDGGSSFVTVQEDGIYRQYSSTNGAGFHFTGNAIFPANYLGAFVDNLIAFGASAYRYTAIYAVNGTIQTSDGNEKQDIDVLSDAEFRVAKKVSKLVKKFRFKDAVVKKGDGARIHIGVIAQDIEAAFASEGLDAHQYGMFCEDSWYTVDGKASPKSEEPYTADTPNAVKVTRKGVRYDELLAFIIAAQNI